MKVNLVPNRLHSKFVITGAINTMFALSIFSMMIHFASHSMNLLVILVASSCISYVSGYILYKTFVWNNGRFTMGEFVRFLKSNLLFLTLNSLILYFFVNRLDFAAIPAQIATTGVLVVVSFLIHDNWTFQNPEHDALPQNFVKE